MTIRELYEDRCKTPHNIDQHMPLLRHYASQCEHITEFGTDIGFSTVAFLDARPKELHCHDLFFTKHFFEIQFQAGVEGMDVYDHWGDTLTCPEIRETDLLFIDTDHAYYQVKGELKRHAHKARRFLIFHDIASFPCIVPAIKEYMEEHKEWYMREWSLRQSGLAVFERIQNASNPIVTTGNEPEVWQLEQANQYAETN